MRATAICCILAAALSGCATQTGTKPLPTNLPLDIGNGVGSQYGNYEMRPAGETTGPEGQRCYVFNWDRPLNKEFAIRYTSASCESKEHPEWMTTTGYVRKVIPIAESDLKSTSDEAGKSP